MQTFEQTETISAVALAPVRCAACQLAIDELQDRSTDDRSPCPRCGVRSRTFAVCIDEAAAAGDFLTLLHERQGEAIGFSTQDPDGRASSAELLGDSGLRSSMEGPASQGEADSLPVCRMLMLRLNQDGARWVDVRKSQHDSIDGEIVESGNPSHTFAVQVVRANATQEVYRTLRKQGSYTETRSLVTAVATLRHAIEHKTPRHGCADPSVVLALDATQLPGLAFDAVVRRFQLDHGRWAAQAGYRAIWLVGPQVRLVWRLDVATDAPDPG